MNTEQLLRDHVHALTREHRVTYTDPETGAVTYPSQMSYFDQLRLEQGSGSRNSGASGSGSRSPIAIQAMMLWTEIRETLNTRYILVQGNDRPDVEPESKLHAWHVHTLADTTGEAQKNCLRSVAGWVQAIESLIRPVRRIEVVGTCPVEGCHATHAWTWAEDEWVRNTAITAAGLEAQCGACGTQWDGVALQELPGLMETAARAAAEAEASVVA
jgi:hypothetical protein